MSDNWLFGPPIPITTGAPPPLVFPPPRKLTREEIFEQRVSWAYSCVAGDGITKDQVRRVLAASDGEVDASS